MDRSNSRKSDSRMDVVVHGNLQLLVLVMLDRMGNHSLAASPIIQWKIENLRELESERNGSRASHLPPLSGRRWPDLGKSSH